MGIVCVALAKVVAGVLTRQILSLLCALLGIPCVYVKRVSQVTSSLVHYSPNFTVLNEVSNRIYGLSIPLYMSVQSNGFKCFM